MTLIVRANARSALHHLRALIGAVGAVLVSSAALASTSGVVISQVYGGGGNTGAPFTNDFIELYNAGAAPVPLNGWSVQYASGTGSTWQVTTLPNFTLAPGQYFLIQQAAGVGGTQALPTPDRVGTIAMGGSAGKVALVTTATALSGATPAATSYQDLVGYGATAFEGTAPAPALTNLTAALRLNNGCVDSNNNGADFSAGAPNPRNTSSPLGSCGAVAQPIVPSCPAALAVATGAVVDFPLSATDADSTVNNVGFVSGNVAGMSLSGFSAATAAGGQAAVKLALAASVAAGNYPVVVQFSNDVGQSASCTVNLSIAAVSPTFTPIYAIQGNGPVSSLPGVRTTRGVVTKVNNNGYFIQDAAGDGDPATSDGIFIFTSVAPFVSPGHLVQVTGTVTEFDVSGATANPYAQANPVTEVINLSATTFLGTGSITPTALVLPLTNAADFERYEGMLVTVAGPLTASQNFFQGRYGQVTMAAGGRLFKPTSVHRPGTAAALALADLNARSSFLLDDGSSVQNPNPTPYLGADNTLRSGDTVPSITGVVDFGLATNFADGIALYKVHPTAAPAFSRTNQRSAAPPAVGGNVKVASFNVLNFFTTFGDGTTAAGASGQTCTQGTDPPAASLCRGADNLAEFNRQRNKIVEAMAAIGADVFGLMEIQNNGNTAAQNLVGALNAKLGANTYAVVPVPPNPGTDAIRVAMIYKPGALSLQGASSSDSNPVHNRPPMAQTFRLGNGEKFSVIVNHFKSKGSCPTDGSLDTDQGDGQGCWNARRVQQAQALLGIIGSIQTAAADNDVMVIGDLNAYGREDPIETFTAAGLVNQVSRFEALPYSYVFDGEAGYLDHALATASLSAQVSGTVHWHINADEPSIIDYNLEFRQPACADCGPDYFTPSVYRSSDHDPVVIGLSLQAAPAAQTITFVNLPDRTLGDAPFALAASATSGLAVSFASGSPAVCTVVGNTVTLLAAGSCSVTASQPGNAAFAPAPTVTRSFAVASATTLQVIDFAALPDRSLGSGAFTVTASASSGLPVTFSSLTPATCSVAGTTVALLAVGTCTVAADQPGNATYAPAPREARSFAVTAITAGGDADSGDIPTLPEWGAILLGLMLLGLGARQRGRPGKG